MDYKYGDLCINKEKLNKFLRGLPKGEYTTFDILREYQGEIKRNEGISAGDSWNAYFGKILGQCANEPNKIIENIAKETKIIVDGGETKTAEWKLLSKERSSDNRG